MSEPLIIATAIGPLDIAAVRQLGVEVDEYWTHKRGSMEGSRFDFEEEARVWANYNGEGAKVVRVVAIKQELP